MPFKTPVNATLTENQNRALAKLSSVNTFLSAPRNPFQNLAKDQQISTFDFSVRALDNIVGNNVSEIILQQFLGKIFDQVGPDKTLLEEMVVKAMAKSLDAKGKTIKDGQTNEQWLKTNILPILTIGKRLLAKQIMTMIFGPKELMSDNPEVQDRLLESSACGVKMFSVTNNPSVSDKELEFNRVRLREQLEKGAVEITINCQKLEIRLPENFEEQFNLQDSETVNIPEPSRPNPATSFVLLSNFVQSEARTQRTEEDSTAVRRGFFHDLIDKLMSHISVSLAQDPDVRRVFDLMNDQLAANNQQPETPESLMSNACDITTACDSGNEQRFNSLAAFSQGLINSLYSLVLSMLLRRLINEARKRVKEVLAAQARERIQKLIRKQRDKFKFLNEATEKAKKVQQYKSNLDSIKDIFEFFKKET